MRKLLLAFISVLFLSGCGDLTGKNTGANVNNINNNNNDGTPVARLLGGISYIELADNKTRLEGTMSKGGAHSFRVKFNLPEGESLRYSFFSAKELNDGVIITFSRVGSDVTANISLNGVSDSRVLNGVGEVVDLVVDIHNDHEDAHILLWNKSGPFGDEEECVDEETCLYNTEYYTFPNDGPWGSQGRAPGTFWGVQGDRSLIILLEGPLGAVSDA